MQYSFRSSLLSRRAWLTRAGSSATLAALSPRIFTRVVPHAPTSNHRSHEEVPPDVMPSLALRAVDAAKSAGAQYADARLTRMIQHRYDCTLNSYFYKDIELVGVGVRVLVNGYWGFASSPFWTQDEVTQLAQNAVAQAQENAKGPSYTVDLGQIPVAKGSWSTPIKIDPFTISIEEKRDMIQYWRYLAEDAYVDFFQNGLPSWLNFVRHERVLATSEGALTTQTMYESSGLIQCQAYGRSPYQTVQGIGVAGKGWELFTEANIPEQFLAMQESDRQRRMDRSKTSGMHTVTVGRYTIVCDGATMASLIESTFGIATQLDRALGYEANAGGTSFIDDPMAMLGTLKVASPLVTVTANRSAPAQLATVKWDDEGILPPETTLVKDGILVNMQTTREQAAWLAPYYQQHGIPIHSNGCATAETALTIPMQHMPNLALTPNSSDVHVSDMIANVPDGIYIEGATAHCDFQARGGLLLGGTMHEIRNGRLVRELNDGGIRFDTIDIWKNVVALGGTSTEDGIDTTQYTPFGRVEKGEPLQATSHSVRAVAATITNQAVLNPSRKA